MTVIIMIIMHHDDDHGRRKLSCSLPRSSSVQQRKLRPGRTSLCLSSTTPPIIMSDERIAALEAQVAAKEAQVAGKEAQRAALEAPLVAMRLQLRREQATNQKLQAKNQKLQAKNQKLQAKNQQLQAKNQQLQATVESHVLTMGGMLQSLTASVGQNGGSDEPGRGAQQEQGGREQDEELELDDSGWFPPRLIPPMKRSHDDE
jgi:hypothetical protein